MSVQIDENIHWAAQIWRSLQAWQVRATMFKACAGSHFIVSGDWGAVQAYLDPDGGRLFWSSLTKHPHTVDITSTSIKNADDENLPLLDSAACQALFNMLEKAEIASLIQVPYGFIVGGKIVAITFTTEPNKVSLSRRTELGLNEDTYVADQRAFRQLCPSQSHLDAWYTQFWSLTRRGMTIKLSGRVRQLRDIRVRRGGSELWIEVQGPDNRTPAFLLGERYVAWDITTNTPSHRQRTGPSTVDRSLKSWFE